MANRKVRMVRNVKLDGKWKFITMDRGRKLKIPDSEGRWYISWREGRRTCWQRANDRTDAYGKMLTKDAELHALARGIQIVADDPSRIPLQSALQQFVEDQKLLKRSKKTVAGYRVTMETFLKSCRKQYLDQVDRRDLLRYADSLRRSKSTRHQPLSERTIFTRWIAILTILKAQGIRGLTQKGDAPQYVEEEPVPYRKEELTALFKVCTPEQHLLFSFYRKTGFRMQEVMYVQYSDINFDHRTVSVKAKPAYGFIPKRWQERTIPLEEGLAVLLEARSNKRKKNELVLPTKNGKPNGKHLICLKRLAKRAGLNEDDVWLHKFRATFGTELLRDGHDIRTVQYLMGHKDIQSTMRYLAPARGKAMSEKFNATFAGA